MRVFLRTILLVILLFTSFLNFSYAQSVSFTAQVKDTSFVFAGYTSPSSLVSFYENSVVIGTTTSDVNGAFSKAFTGVTPGVHSITIGSVDSGGTATRPIQFDLVIIAKQEMAILNIYLPPSIEIRANSYKRGESIVLSGYAKPTSLINLHLINLDRNIVSVIQVSTNSQGFYTNTIKVASLVSGHYRVTPELVISGIIDNATIGSNYDFLVSNIVPIISGNPQKPNTPEEPEAICPYPYPRICFFDKQKLGYLDESDEFLSFLDGYIKYWGQDFNTMYDINEDKSITSLDLSIILYYWKGDNKLIKGYYDNSLKPNYDVLGAEDSQAKKDFMNLQEQNLIKSFLVNEFYVLLIIFSIFTLLVLLRKSKAKITHAK